MPRATTCEGSFVKRREETPHKCDRTEGNQKATFTMSQKVGISIHVRMGNMAAVSYWRRERQKSGNSVNQQEDLGLPVSQNYYNCGIPPGSYEYKSGLGVAKCEGFERMETES